MEKKKRGGAPGGLAHLYAQLLNDAEQQHQETVAATMEPEEKPQRSGIIGPQAPNLTIVKPPEMASLSDLELAKIARGQGKSVELNDDNQIVDKRELLSAGLNLSAPNTRKLGLVTKKKGEEGDGEVQVHRAVGTAASKREIDERRRKEIVKQMEEEKYRMREEREKEEAEKIARTVAKRNTDEDVMSAKERYLARKKRKLEEQQAAEAAPEAAIGDPAPQT
jgi:coiled-coil domain-containing protein 55